MLPLVRPADHDPEVTPQGAWLSSEPSVVPMLPPLAHRIIDVASDPAVTVARLAALVSKDQVLASRVLGLANSAYSAPMRTVATVAEAIVRVGTAAVRNVVITVCFTARMHDPRVYGHYGAALADHALGTAYLARLVAERVRVREDEAFLCGLLHDFGKLVILKQAHDCAHRTGVTVPTRELEAAMRVHHAGFGAMALRRWRLPDSLEEPVLCHHDYAAARAHRLQAAVVYLANRLSHRYGFGCEDDESHLFEDPVCGLLGIDQAWLDEIDARAPGLVQVARETLS